MQGKSNLSGSMQRLLQFFEQKELCYKEKSATFMQSIRNVSALIALVEEANVELSLLNTIFAFIKVDNFNLQCDDFSYIEIAINNIMQCIDKNSTQQSKLNDLLIDFHNSINEYKNLIEIKDTQEESIPSQRMQDSSYDTRPIRSSNVSFSRSVVGVGRCGAYDELNTQNIGIEELEDNDFNPPYSSSDEHNRNKRMPLNVAKDFDFLDHDKQEKLMPLSEFRKKINQVMQEERSIRFSPVNPEEFDRFLETNQNSFAENYTANLKKPSCQSRF
ncbi:hypothetical protein [Candidatus Deianiraea vastatrix]|nr:hypothetical protein [Candidatus Deianiraea vastatrix]